MYATCNCCIVMQVIDTFHFQNHTDENCISKYNPDIIKKQHPDYNFMSCEQTFVWLSRYKKMLCSMNKNHHLYFLHRMITHRNKYTEICHQIGRKPLLPKAKNVSKLVNNYNNVFIFVLPIISGIKMNKFI